MRPNRPGWRLAPEQIMAKSGPDRFRSASTWVGSEPPHLQICLGKGIVSVLWPLCTRSVCVCVCVCVWEREWKCLCECVQSCAGPYSKEKPGTHEQSYADVFSLFWKQRRQLLLLLVLDQPKEWLLYKKIICKILATRFGWSWYIYKCITFERWDILFFFLFF